MKFLKIDGVYSLIKVDMCIKSDKAAINRFSFYYIYEVSNAGSKWHTHWQNHNSNITLPPDLWNASIKYICA